MAHIFRTITLITFIATTSTVVVGSDLSSANSWRSGVPGGASMVEARVQTTAPVGPTASPVEPLTDVEQGLVDWAKGRFAQAGLELPELAVRFDPSRDLCQGSDGLYQNTSNGTPVVTICTRDSDTFAAQLQRRRTLLHEFGHAWDSANMSAGDRQELGRILGADAWNDHDHRWADRGVERFAETFVFALLDQPARQLKVSVSCSDLLSAFGTATGVEPLGPGLPYCTS